MTEAFPLHWPEGRPRTPADDRKTSRFDQSHDAAISFTTSEVARLGGIHMVISTDVELRRDGRPYANQRIQDTGAAVYFMLKKQQMAFACDRWDRLADNIYAIGKTIEALRGIARWGTGEMQQAAFTGFMQLEAPGAARHWRVVLGLAQGPVTSDQIDDAWRTKVKASHPDRGGSAALTAEINTARAEAKRAMGL